MKMKRMSPVVRCGLILLCFIAFLILLENMFNLAPFVKIETEAKKEQEKFAEEYEKTEEYQQEIYIEKSIAKTVEFLQNGDYESIYNYLDPRYKLCAKIDSVESLKTRFKELYGNEPISFALDDFTEVQDRFHCNIFVSTVNENLMQKMIIIPSGDDEFSLMFEAISEIYEYPSNVFIVGPKLKYKLDYKMRRIDDFICTFEVTNMTQQTISGSLEKTNITTTDKRTYNVSNPEELRNIVLAPGESKILLYRIDISNGKYLDDKYINFVFTELDGTESEDSILISNL